VAAGLDEQHKTERRRAFTDDGGTATGHLAYEAALHAPLPRAHAAPTHRLRRRGRSSETRIDVASGLPASKEAR
jgi:hypothetical protein